ncbi:MAG: FAD-dependent oxidoreductase, partial [Myxococcales bacterium]|nr:FAD-dependent oxidoreductase [Myxococcales bacterium]
IADKMGFKRVDTNLSGPIYIANRKASKLETDACEKIYEQLEKAMDKQIESGRDVPISALLPKDKKCADLVASNIGPFENGAEIEKVSSIAAGLFETGNDDFIKEGLGTFVESFGKNVPVRLNSIVNKIEYGPSGVRVSLMSGEKFFARRVLVTVSTGVLASGTIYFDPPLPNWKQEAIKKLPMGLLNKVVLQFKKDIFEDTPKNSWVLWDGPGNDNVAFVIRPFDTPIAVAFYGGEQAKNFEQDDAAAIDHAKRVLEKMYGSKVEIELEKSALTKWGKNPWSLGAYSYVTPGASTTHNTLLKPVDERLFFSGEACSSPKHNGTVHGAYESSIRASKLFLRSLAE